MNACLLFTKAYINIDYYYTYFSFVCNFLLSEYRNGNLYIENMCHNRFNTKKEKKVSEAKNRYNQIVMLWNIYEVPRCSKMSQNVSQQGKH